MTDNSRRHQPGPAPSPSRLLSACRQLSDLLDHVPSLDRPQSLNKLQRRARWPVFAQGRAVLDSHHHEAIRSIRAFANDDDTALASTTLLSVSGIAAALYANTHRPVRSDILQSLSLACLRLISLSVGPTVPAEQSWFRTLGVDAAGDVSLQQYLAALVDHIGTGPSYVPTSLGVQLSTLLGDLVASISTDACHDLSRAISPAARHLGFVCSAAVFAGTMGAIAGTLPDHLPPPTIYFEEGGWSLHGTFQPVMRLLLARDSSSARFAASGSAVSTLCAVFLADPSAPTCGPPELCLRYPYGGLNGSLTGARGQIALTAASFVAVQRLIHRYFEDPHRVEWSSYAHAIYGDL